MRGQGLQEGKQVGPLLVGHQHGEFLARLESAERRLRRIRLDDLEANGALRAALRALPVLTAGKGLSFVYPPDGMDPDDVARKQGAEGVDAMLSQAFGIAEILWMQAVIDMGDRSPERMARVRKQLRDALGTIRDPDVRAAMTSDFRQRFEQLEGRQHNLPGRAAPTRQAVNSAVQEAIIKGMLLFPRALGGIEEEALRIQWVREDHARLADVLIASAYDEADLNECLQRNGVAGIAASVRQSEVLRMPFLRTQDRAAAEKSLVDAIRATINPRQR